MQKQIIELVEELIQKAEKAFKIDIFRPEIRFNIKARTLAGEFQHDRDAKTGYILRFHPGLMAAYGQEYLETVVHEVAHLVTQTLNPVATPHGFDWQETMKFFDAKPTREFDFDIDRVPAEFLTKRARTWKYACDCQIHDVTTRMHNTIKKGRSRSCITCKTRLRPCGDTK